MKLIIDIPDKAYEACKDAVEESYPSQIEEVIANGTPYEPKKNCFGCQGDKDFGCEDCLNKQSVDLDKEIKLYKAKAAFYKSRKIQEYDDTARELNFVVELLEKLRSERLQNEWIEFARWVAKEVLDNYFEESSGAFAEIACRKLVKLGLVEVKDNVYKRKGDTE